MDYGILKTASGEKSIAKDGISEMVIGHDYHFGWQVQYARMVEKEEFEPGFYRAKWWHGGDVYHGGVYHEDQHHTPDGCEPGDDSQKNVEFRRKYAEWLSKQTPWIEEQP